jgi:NADPH2:quinone reductase
MGIFIGKNLPFVLGSNIAGIVQTVGREVTKYTVGQHIYGQGRVLDPVPDSAGLQEYAIMRPDFSGPVPSGFTDDQFATLPVNATTSFTALFHPEWLGLVPPFPSFEQESKPNYEQESLVVIGAGSNVGKLAVQFARIRGIGKIIAVASASRTSELKGLGATHVIDRHSSAIVEEVQAITGGPESATRVYDCVSWTYELAAAIVPQTRPSFILTLHPPQNAVEELTKLGKQNCVAKVVTGSQNNFEGSPVGDLFWDTLGTWVQEGKIKIQNYRTIQGLDEKRVNEALDSYRDGSPVVQAIVNP